MSPVADPQAAIVRALRRPGAYPRAGGRVEVRETHISWVFLAGDRAYKIKKAVRFPFVDYGTLARRRAMCAAEVELNRRLAPELYLGVRAIVPAGRGVALADEDDPAAIEYAVEMRRFDEGDTMAARLAAHDLSTATAGAVGRRLAAFHADAAPLAGVDARGSVERRLAETLRTLGRFVEDPAERARLAALRRFGRAFLAGHGQLLAARAAAGRVRDGHGDLRAEHVLLEGGEVHVVDCAEFDPALRHIDVGADLAFLVMELEDGGAPRLAGAVVDAYRIAGGDPGDDALLAFFAADRALTRAKVSRLKAAQGAAPARRRAAERDAVRLTGLAERLAWRARLPLVVAVCGGPATGKSTLAAALASASSLPHLSSDVVRKELAGLQPTQRAGPEHYAPAVTERVYRELGRHALAAIGRDGGAIVDATFRTTADRERFREELGAGAGALAWVRCQAPAAVVAARARSRLADPRRISDAGPELAGQLAAGFEPLAEVAARHRATVRTDRPIAGVLDRAVAFLDARLASELRG